MCDKTCRDVTCCVDVCLTAIVDAMTAEACALETVAYVIYDTWYSVDILHDV